MRLVKYPTILFLSLMLLGIALPAQHIVAAENPRIVDGSKVTFLYAISIAGNVGVTIRDVGEFSQGQHQILPSLEREMTGMQAG